MRSIAAYFLTVLLVCTSLWAVAPATGSADRPATQPSEKAERQPGKLLLMKTAEPPGATRDRKCPVALLLCPTRQEEEFRKNWTSRLFRSGFCSVAAVMRESKWMAGHADVLIQDLDNIAHRSTMDLGRIIVIASGDAGVVGMELMDRYPKRLSGLVMISTAPWARTPAGIQLWTPREAAGSIPLWTTSGTRAKDAAATLLLWRRSAAIAPGNVSITIDPRIGKGSDEAQPDEAIEKWLAAIMTGEKPAAGPDQQAVGETKRYKTAAKRLHDAMGKVPAARGGREFTKQEGPMCVSVGAPMNWLRAIQGERKYQSDKMPYVQIYLTPRLGGLLFARVNAARWAGRSEALLDDYEARMRKAGFLTIRFHRWSARGFSLQISSALWPSPTGWHRWLMLIGAGQAFGHASGHAAAAPLVFVMDASDKPDVTAMAAAMKHLLSSTSAIWTGETAGSAGGLR